MENDTSTIYLLTGELAVLPQPKDVVFTVLGSCVSVIFHVSDSISMVTHAMLPAPSLSSDPCPSCTSLSCMRLGATSKDFKFVSCSVQYMINRLIAQNIDLNGVHVSLVGGGTVLQNMDSSGGIGFKNIAMAKHILARSGMVIKREHTGGYTGRNLRYFSKGNRLVLKIHGQSEEMHLTDKHHNAAVTPQQALDKLLLDI